TEVPTAPKVGEKPVSRGWTTKFVAEKAEPAGAVTRSVPVVAPVGTTTEILVLLTTVKVVAALLLKETLVTPKKLAPIRTTLVPARPVVGEKLEIVGGTKKLELVVQLPLGELTVSGPLVTPAGVSTRIRVSDVTAKFTPGWPLKVALVTPVSWTPLMK